MKRTPVVDVLVLEHLFDQVPDVAFFVKDLAGCYTAVNASLVARHGLRDQSQVLGKRPRDICPGDFGNIPSRQDAAVRRHRGSRGTDRHLARRARTDRGA